MIRRASVAITVVLSLTASACSDGEDESERPAGGERVALQISFKGRTGAVSRAELRCSESGIGATAWLAGRDRKRLCAEARRLAPFIAEEPDPGRVCTQIYGGPQWARIRGRVGELELDRSFSRRNGCEIDDYERVAALLPAQRGIR